MSSPDERYYPENITGIRGQESKEVFMWLLTGTQMIVVVCWHHELLFGGVCWFSAGGLTKTGGDF